MHPSRSKTTAMLAPLLAVAVLLTALPCRAGSPYSLRGPEAVGALPVGASMADAARGEGKLDFEYLPNDPDPVAFGSSPSGSGVMTAVAVCGAAVLLVVIAAHVVENAAQAAANGFTEEVLGPLVAPNGGE